MKKLEFVSKDEFEKLYPGIGFIRGDDELGLEDNIIVLYAVDRLKDLNNENT